MHERCPRPPTSATRSCGLNSGRAESVRIKIQNAQPKGLAHDIEDQLCGVMCVNAIHDQIEAHKARLTLDVTMSACRLLPQNVREAILADILGPLGYVAIKAPERGSGDTMSDLAAAGAEVGDVHRVVPSSASRDEKLREIHEAIAALTRVAEGLS